jgi:hypothetical protein
MLTIFIILIVAHAWAIIDWNNVDRERSTVEKLKGDF